SVFYYVFFPTSHRFFFESKSGQYQFSPGLAARMFEQLFARRPILNEYGAIDVTVEPSTESLERIFKMPRLRRLWIELTRPNADDLASARRKVMERLQIMKAKSQAIELLAQRGESLEPDPETRTLAQVAQ